MPRYNPNTIEPRWQKYWDEHKTFRTPEMPGERKMYVLDMFPYPSGDGLHVGHPEGYTATDIVCRFQRMRGNTVLHPMGFDAFGLPAEEHAIETNTPPRAIHGKEYRQLHAPAEDAGVQLRLGSRALATTDVEYFRWTQWIFLQLYSIRGTTEQQQQGRPIAELPIPAASAAAGDAAIRSLSGRTSTGLSSRCTGQLVPRSGDRAGQRRSH